MWKIHYKWLHDGTIYILLAVTGGNKIEQFTTQHKSIKNFQCCMNLYWGWAKILTMNSVLPCKSAKSSTTVFLIIKFKSLSMTTRETHYSQVKKP